MAMEIKTVRVSEKGQIAIPTSMRASIGIEQGDELLLVETEGKILVEKADKVSQSMKDDFEDILKYNEDSLKEVWDNKEDDIWASYLRK
jgi:AbrB family looped-hinge helix DNA binding protein